MNVKKVVFMEQYRQKNKQNKPKKRLKKRLNTFFFSLFVMGVIGGVFYFTSPLRKLSMVYFEGLNYVSRSEVLQLANLSYDDDYFKLKTKKIASQIQKHPLITKAVVTRVGLNELRILVEEKDVIGCVDMGDGYQYVLSDGHLIEQSNTLDVVCPGTIIYGLTEKTLKEPVLGLFIESMMKLDPILINLIKEIHYEPLYGDNNRFSLFLQDGNTIKVNSYSMVEKLKYYQTMVDQVRQLSEGQCGTYYLDVGDYFEPYSGANSVLFDNKGEQDMQEE